MLLKNSVVISQNNVDSPRLNLTEITTDRMRGNNNTTVNWTAARCNIDCPDNPNKPPKQSFLQWLGSLFTSVGDFFGDLWDTITSIFQGGGSGGGGGGSPIGPPAGPTLGTGTPNGNNGSPIGGGGSAPNNTGSNTPPPINPSSDDNDSKNDCSGTTSTIKKFIVANDTCQSGKSINTYRIATDCYGNIFTALLNQECLDCNNYPVGYGYDQNATVNWIDNSYTASNSTSFITFNSAEQIAKWNSLADFRLSARQVANIDSLRQNGVASISVTDVSKLKPSGDSLTQYVNFDEYSVQVDTLPVVATKRLTATQLLEHIRLNFEQFQDTPFQKIAPYNATYKTIWSNTSKFRNANTGVVLKIQRASGSNGVAIATNINSLDTLSKKFIITNVTDPNLNGTRNYNSNREFGYRKNTNNSYTFYCRTVDRTTKQSNFLSKVLHDTLIEADRGVGETFSRTVNNFINQNSGKAVENDFEITQANEQAIKDVLLGFDELCGLSDNIDDDNPINPPVKDTSYSIKIGNGTKKYKDGDTIKMSAKDTCINWSIESSKGSITASGINWNRNKSTIARNSLSANICQYFDGNFKISIKKGKNELISVILKDTIICPTDANLKVTSDMLLRMYPEAKKERCDSVSKYLNMYMKDYKINTRQRLAHFLTQVFVETGGFRDRTEGVYKTKERIIEIFKDKKKTYNFIDTSNVAQYVNCTCLFDRVYAYKDSNGSEASKDGSLFRGRGAIQLTSRESYTKFTRFYQQKYNDYNTSFVTNPELVADNWKYFVLAALWEFSIDKNALEFADRDNINKVSRIVNGGDNLLPERQAQLPITKSKLCL